jgi:hypothetical protein
MLKNSQNFSMQEAMRLANSDAGKQLLAILKESDSTMMQQAMDDASAGNYENMQKTLSSLLSSPQVQALLKELGG